MLVRVVIMLNQCTQREHLFQNTYNAFDWSLQRNYTIKKYHFKPLYKF